MDQSGQKKRAGSGELGPARLGPKTFVELGEDEKMLGRGNVRVEVGRQRGAKLRRRWRRERSGGGVHSHV